ncbi:MAG: (d)CMP kinase [Oscillospiraceae bacterium]|nr:(d)CMP kinase [Oscillospiraceae bacterium]
MKHISIAIDGPVGAGKSSISREVAKGLGFIYVDTGALYRTLGVYSKLHSLSPSCELPKITIKFIDGLQHVFANGVDYTDKIRTPEASMLASDISAKPEIREYLLELQREFARTASVVMDGRDIGTVVLPNATLKIFLTASPEERACRRHEELLRKDSAAAPSYESVLEDLKLRDHNDSTRTHAPLKQADDAVVVDTTGNTFEQSVEVMLKTIKERI